jgi:hypothetical protein
VSDLATLTAANPLLVGRTHRASASEGTERSEIIALCPVGSPVPARAEHGPISLIAVLAPVRTHRHLAGKILALLCRLRRDPSDLRPSRADDPGKCLTSRRRVPDDGGGCPVEFESAAFSLELVQIGLPTSTALHGCSPSPTMSAVSIRPAWTPAGQRGRTLAALDAGSAMRQTSLGSRCGRRSVGRSRCARSSEE